jgi:hypothetical protein
MVVTSHGVLQVLIDIGVLWQDRHHSEILVAGRAKRPKASNVRDCHTIPF